MKGSLATASTSQHGVDLDEDEDMLPTLPCLLEDLERASGAVCTSTPRRTDSLNSTGTELGQQLLSLPIVIPIMGMALHWPATRFGDAALHVPVDVQEACVQLQINEQAALTNPQLAAMSRILPQPDTACEPALNTLSTEASDQAWGFHSGQQEQPCNNCQQLLTVGDELMELVCLDGKRPRPELKQRAAHLTFKATCCCKRMRDSSTAQPCLAGTVAQLGSSGVHGWCLTPSKARSAAAGAKRAANGSRKELVWNVNWNANSPEQLPQQAELWDLLHQHSSHHGGSSSSASNSASGGSSSSNVSVLPDEAASTGVESMHIPLCDSLPPPTLYGIRTSHGPKAVYGVAQLASPEGEKPTEAGGTQPMSSSGSAASTTQAGTRTFGMEGASSDTATQSGLWPSTVVCRKTRHTLCGQSLALFKYAFVVYMPQQAGQV